MSQENPADSGDLSSLKLTSAASSSTSLEKVNSPDSGHKSPLRHHQRKASVPRIVRETSNASAEYTSPDGDGSSQLRINQYTIGPEIGRGSFGAVHLAIDHEGKEYAVKEFSKSRLRRRAKSLMMRRARQRTGTFPLGQSLLERQRTLSPPDDADNSFDLIKEEIAVMKKLNHENIVSLIEVLDNPDEDSLWMVLEMCKKGVVMKVELDSDADPYEEELCRTWFRDLILGIEYLHAQGVVHRDIKPDNCLLTEDETLKVVDFGVSEMFDKDSDMRIAKSAGSPAFMAPELCQTSHGEVDGRSADIWSMGVTLYCLRHGTVPFRHSNMLQLYESIRNDVPDLHWECSEDFADLMQHILHKDPKQRIRMAELREHSWVTLRGTDPLLPASENCANIIELPTEEEKENAITGKMSRLVAVLKAVNRFKSLTGKKRTRFDSILEHASHFVQPPLSMIREHRHIRNALTKPSDSEYEDEDEAALHDSHHPVIQHVVSGISQLTQQLRSGQILPSPRTNKDAAIEEGGIPAPDRTMSLPSPPAAHDEKQTPPLMKSHTMPLEGKGHAHDPLEDDVWLNIGPDPEDVDPADEDSMGHIVSESPPPASFPVYEKAYEEEVTKIRRHQGHHATVYLTRRVEGSVNAKLHAFASRHSSGEGSEAQGLGARSKAATGLADLVSKTSSKISKS